MAQEVGKNVTIACFVSKDIPLDNVQWKFVSVQTSLSLSFSLSLSLLRLMCSANVFISSFSALFLYIGINSCASQPGLILFSFFWGGGGMTASEWRQRDYFSGCVSDQTT